MFEVDELKLYRGDDIIIIPDKIVITQPTINQICDYGEGEYLSAVHTLCASGSDLKWQLWDYHHIEYDKISDFDIFKNVTSQSLGSNKKVYQEVMSHADLFQPELASIREEGLNILLKNPLQLVFKNLDFADFHWVELEDGLSVFRNDEQDITIDRMVFGEIVKVLRKIHFFKRSNDKPANDITREVLIDDAREEAELNSKKEQHSALLSLVSYLECKIGESVWDAHINKFFYLLRRFGKINEAEMLLSGAYSGFADLKGVDKKRLDATSDIDI